MKSAHNEDVIAFIKRNVIVDHKICNILHIIISLNTSGETFNISVTKLEIPQVFPFLILL